MFRRSAWLDDDSLAIFTDLYELTMLQAYWKEGMGGDAVFSLFARRLPETRNFLLFCGLPDVLDYLERLRFTDEALGYLETLGCFRPEFLDWLKDFRFEGDVWAMPEGTPFFADEPILEVAAPVWQAQLLETFIMNQVHWQTVAASKAVRVVLAAAGRPVVDFGLRRMHGTDAGVKAARAFHIAGAAATSNVFAGQVYGIPVAGTMAHSFVQAHDSEMDSFRAFAGLYPETILLVDTYDTPEGVRKVAALARELGEDFRVRGVRLDSGDLAQLAFGSRRILDAAGLSQVSIFASGSLDEYAVADMLAQGAPVDGFGVGTKMGVSADAPYLDMVYKLTEYAGTGRVKTSPGKQTLPGRKQVFRVEKAGVAVRDVIAASGEEQPGRPLLSRVMEKGRRLPAGETDLEAARERAAQELARLPEELRGISPARPPYPVAVSPVLDRRRARIAARAGSETT